MSMQNTHKKNFIKSKRKTTHKKTNKRHNKHFITKETQTANKHIIFIYVHVDINIYIYSLFNHKINKY